MTAAPYPPFRHPEDWRPELNKAAVLHGPAAKELLLVDEATANHDDRHQSRRHPWCVTCEAGASAQDIERDRISAAADIRACARRLGDPSQYNDLLEQIVDLVNRRSPAPIDVDALADTNQIDTDTVRAAIAYAYADDRYTGAQLAHHALEVAEETCLSRAHRYLRLHNDRIPADTYDPDLDSGEDLDGYAGQVAAEALRLRVREDARTLHERQKAERDPADPFDAGLLAEILARPAEPTHRIAGLIPADASTLIVAQRKTGKTTFNLNLARALITGERFLDEFTVQAITGRVAILNFEVSAAQLARWANDVGIDPERLYLVNLRGRRNPLAHPTDRQKLAAQLRDQDVETLMIDPFANAYTGQSQNDAGEVGAWLRDLDLFTRAEVGARDLVLNVHAGWNAERSRGASALEDWADSIVTLTRGDGDDTSRYLRAVGRDVDIEEDGLAFHAPTRTLSLARTGSRRTTASAHQLELVISAVHGVVTASPGVNGTQVEETIRRQGVKFQKGTERKALAAACERGLIHTKPGTRNAKHYYPGKPPRTSPSPPAGEAATLPSSPLYGGAGSQGHLGVELPHLIDTNDGDAT